MKNMPDNITLKEVIILMTCFIIKYMMNYMMNKNNSKHLKKK